MTLVQPLNCVFDFEISACEYTESHLSVDTDVPQTLLAGVESTVKAVYAFAAGSSLYVGFCSVFELTRKPVREFGVRTISGRGNILPSSSIK